MHLIFTSSHPAVQISHARLSTDYYKGHAREFFFLPQMGSQVDCPDGKSHWSIQTWS